MHAQTRVLVASLVLGVALATAAHAQTKLLRYPDIHGDRVVFCYAADIWWAPATGGSAVRLTAHSGIEQFHRNRNAIKVAIIDVMMPGMTGDQVLKTLRLFAPQLPVVLVSGFTDSRVVTAEFGAHTESVQSNWSWYRNIFANAHNRNPLAKVNTVFVNNLLYNDSAGYTTHTSTPHGPIRTSAA